LLAFAIRASALIVVGAGLDFETKVRGGPFTEPGGEYR